MSLSACPLLRGAATGSHFPISRTFEPSLSLKTSRSNANNNKTLIQKIPKSRGSDPKTYPQLRHRSLGSKSTVTVYVSTLVFHL